MQVRFSISHDRSRYGEVTFLELVPESTLDGRVCEQLYLLGRCLRATDAVTKNPIFRFGLFELGGSHGLATRPVPVMPDGEMSTALEGLEKRIEDIEGKLNLRPPVHLIKG